MYRALRLIPRFLGIRTAAVEPVAKFNFTMKNVSKVLDNQVTLLKDVNLSFLNGAKIGVIGVNGSGKSSLMKIMAGLDNNYSGEAVAARDVKVGYLAQEPVLDNKKNVLDNVLDGMKEVTDLLTRFEMIAADMGKEDADFDALLKEQEEVQAKIEALNGWDVERISKLAMIHLNCPTPDSSVVNLSGGERRRVALARLLVAQPQMLLLDEPTNHLDATSVAWLEKFLQAYKGTVLAVTHDRYFLDNVATWILEIDRGSVYPFKGNYTLWLEAKRKRLDMERKRDAAQAKMMDRELQWLRTPLGGRRVKNKARITAYEEMADKAAKIQHYEHGSLVIPPGPRLGDQVIELRNVSKSYDDKKLLADVSIRIERGAIVGIVGVNGAGKSTLFKVITGDEKPDSGSVHVGQTVKLGFVAQSRDALRDDNTLYQEIAQGQEQMTIGETTLSMRHYVAQFNFKSASQEKRMHQLSGGERNRVHLAKMLKSGANVLLLDEPTNDLDVETLRALETALPDFVGCVLVISHDRYFLDRICTHTLSFEGNGVVEYFDGTYSEYEAHRKSLKKQTHSHLE
eukprot:TRINITY_DN13449_c0_g1_i1.p1 TRINITY_DN13449_c0_g1~~TRINITY_DN13449_c0_g1_i1.p1  ORF type:complete len:569 (+),score=141.10 TRINITY_DN13449_c0_g1_i1:111-1817(+)